MRTFPTNPSVLMSRPLQSRMNGTRGSRTALGDSAGGRGQGQRSGEGYSRASRPRPPGLQAVRDPDGPQLCSLELSLTLGNNSSHLLRVQLQVKQSLRVSHGLSSHPLLTNCVALSRLLDSV